MLVDANGSPSPLFPTGRLPDEGSREFLLDWSPWRMLSEALVGFAEPAEDLVLDLALLFSNALAFGHADGQGHVFEKARARDIC